MNEEKSQVYGYRWILLFIFMLGNLSLQILWISYATVTLDAAAYYNVNEFEILFLSTIFMITYIPVSFIATWFINKFGFRMGVGLGAIINGVFGFSRALAGPNYLLVLFLTIMISVSQPFFLNSVSLLSANWFPESERTKATGLSIISQFLGIAIGMVLTPILVVIYSFEVMLFIYGLYSLIIGILFIILARDRPPTPPSIKVLKEDDKLKGGLKMLFSNKQFWILMIVFFVGLGAFNMVTTYIELIVVPRGLTSIEAGNLGGILLLGGIIGAQLMSILADKLRKKAILIKISLVITVASFFLISFANTTIMLYVSGLLLGFGLLSVGPVLIEYAVDITAPVPEASSNGVLMVIGSISGIIFIVAFEKLTTPSGDYLPALIVLSILSLVAFLLSFFLKETKRE
ncbi:MAG: MFS transporter [Candidatus Lokiarchaeota archaeon]|nr:MFS transporter [Candidatus Lokiarchaeota archaeon]